MNGWMLLSPWEVWVGRAPSSGGRSGRRWTDPWRTSSWSCSSWWVGRRPPLSGRSVTWHTGQREKSSDALVNETINIYIYIPYIEDITIYVTDPCSYIEDESRDRSESLDVDHGQSIWKVALAGAHKEQPGHNKQKLKQKICTRQNSCRWTSEPQCVFLFVCSTWMRR